MPYAGIGYFYFFYVLLPFHKYIRIFGSIYNIQYTDTEYRSYVGIFESLTKETPPKTKDEWKIDRNGIRITKNEKMSNNNIISMQLNALNEIETSTNKDILIAARHLMHEEMWTYSSLDSVLRNRKTKMFAHVCVRYALMLAKHIRPERKMISMTYLWANIYRNIIFIIHMIYMHILRPNTRRNSYEACNILVWTKDWLILLSNIITTIDYFVSFYKINQMPELYFWLIRFSSRNYSFSLIFIIHLVSFTVGCLYSGSVLKAVGFADPNTNPFIEIEWRNARKIIMMIESYHSVERQQGRSTAKKRRKKYISNKKGECRKTWQDE